MQLLVCDGSLTSGWLLQAAGDSESRRIKRKVKVAADTAASEQP